MQVTDEMVERARIAWLEHASDYTRLDVSIRAALEAALTVGGLCLVEIGSLSEHKLGVAWFQRTFGVPLGDKPSGKKSDEILSLIAAVNDGEERK